MVGVIGCEWWGGDGCKINGFCYMWCKRFVVIGGKS